MQYSDIILSASQKYNIHPSIIAAVIHAESNFNPNAISSAGAQGLMQLMPATARSLGVTDSFDPYQNIMGGTQYLSQQIQRFGSLDLGLAAYNAGPGAVEQYNGVPPYQETQNYIARVLSLIPEYQNNINIVPSINNTAIISAISIALLLLGYALIRKRAS